MKTSLEVYKELFKKRFEIARNRGWESIIVAVDLHDTVIDSVLFNKQRLPKGLAVSVIDSIYSEAIRTLKMMSVRKDIKLVWYTGTDQDTLDQVTDVLKSEHGIHFEGRADGSAYPLVHKGQSFEHKPCFDVIIDDKAGFDPFEDWSHILTAVNREVL